MKLKKFLSMLLIGGMVASSVPMHAMTDNSIEKFKEITSTYAGKTEVVGNDKIINHLSDLYEVVRDVTDEKDFIVLDGVKRFLEHLLYEGAQSEDVKVLTGTMINICSAHKLLFKIESFTLDEYNQSVSDLLYNISSLSKVSSDSSLRLKEELIKRSRILITILNYHAMSRKMGVPKINFEQQ